MNKKLLTLVVLTQSWLTSINAMGAASAAVGTAKRLIEINQTFVERHNGPFAQFVADMEWKKGAVQTTVQIPLLGRLTQIVASAAGYEEALKDINYLDRFFQKREKQTEVIQRLFRDSEYQQKATHFLSIVFHGLEQGSDPSKPKLLELLHKQNAKVLKQEGTTRAELCKKVIDGEIPDAGYFESTLLILLAIYIYENSLHKE